MISRKLGVIAQVYVTKIKFLNSAIEIVDAQ